MILLISELDHFYSVTTLWTGERSAWYRVPALACNENGNNKTANLTKLTLRERATLRDQRNITPRVREETGSP